MSLSLAFIEDETLQDHVLSLFSDTENIRQITALDDPFFEDLLAQDNLKKIRSDDPYLLSPTYFLLTGRRGLWVFEGDQKIVFCLHPNIQDCFMVFPNLTGDSLMPPKELADILRVASMKIIVGRIPKETPLHKIASRDFSLNVKNESVLDWSFPVHTLDLGQLEEHRGKKYQNLRTSINHWRDRDVVFTPLDFGNSDEIFQNISEAWKNGALSLRSEFNEIGYFNTLARLGASAQNIHALGMYEAGQPVGFTVWENIKQTGVSNLFAAQTVPNASSDACAFAIYTSAMMAKEQGAKKMCLGGSETDGMDAFKRKFVPNESLGMFSIQI